MTKSVENVQPIRTLEQHVEFIEAIRKMSPKTADRNVLLYNLGISTGLRIGDLVKLRIEDVKGKSSLRIQEGKTKKPRTVYLDNIMADIADYLENMASEGYLFPSAKGGYITTTQAYRALQKAADYLEWDWIGTHTLRKTYGYQYYKAYNNIVDLCEIFNHSSQAVTRRYIGLREEELGVTQRNFKPFG
ncbi:tyrosine-type recombinase/integrase [Sporosarcina aquimarina]|uniref:tyrosine-type recombinase/integrase n=1 Tax=Sporosarcina aquimarina TaxID=114975 RepID=UPI001C8EB443|nr:tyrosine-type recombinase/integrase [Sporosarcina aquimarina]MBY0221956.1 tyrosine-type recombinase/integrase [Sporosarcina aquimarina]